MKLSAYPDILLMSASAQTQERVRSATARLAAVAGSATDQAESLVATTDAPARSSPEVDHVRPAPFSSVRSVVSTGNLKTPAKQFEAFVLQSVISEVLPKDTEAVFGSGFAGDTWRLMLAEKLSEVLVARGGIGLSSLFSAPGEARHFGKTA